MSSIDEKKRSTLKTFAATGVGMAASAAGIEFAIASNQTHPASSFPLPASTNPELGITIVNSSGVVENTVVLRNNTSEPMAIDRFRAGQIVFDGKQVDLSVLNHSGTVTLDAHQTLSVAVEVTPVGDEPNVEYLWAQQSATVLGDNSVVVELGAFIANADAVVFPALTSSVAA